MPLTKARADMRADLLRYCQMSETAPLRRAISDAPHHAVTVPHHEFLADSDQAMGIQQAPAARTQATELG